MLVTHAGGIAVVDLEADDPAIVDVVLAGHPYGAGASAYGGSVAYALDPATGLVDRVDVTAAACDSIDTGGPVLDLAVSPPDSHWLYVAGVPGQEIVRLDTTDGTLSAVGVPGGDRHRGRPRQRRRAGGVDALPGPDRGRRRDREATSPARPNLGTAASTPRAAPITCSPRTPPASVAHLRRRSRGRAGMPAGASSWRSRVATAYSSRRRRTGPCWSRTAAGWTGTSSSPRALRPRPPATGDCVPIATVSLLPGGRIGTIELRRLPMLLSNAVLLDLIVCLAARVDACCGARPPARITIDPPAFPPGQVGTLYPDASPTASGGRPPYALEVLSGVVPPGLTAQSPGTGPLVLSGTPIQAGTFTFVVRATDADGVRATRGYSVPVRRQSTEAPMRIRAVEFLARHSIGAGGFETVVVGELRLGEPTVITDNGFFGIRVTFTEPVDFSTLTTAELGGGPPDAANFLVAEGGRGPLTGRLSRRSR